MIVISLNFSSSSYSNLSMEATRGARLNSTGASGASAAVPDVSAVGDAVVNNDEPGEGSEDDLDLMFQMPADSSGANDSVADSSMER